MPDLHELRKELFINLFVCPVCRGRLKFVSDMEMTCSACGQVIPIRDEIPVFAPYLFDQFYEQWKYKRYLELSPKASWLSKGLDWLRENLGLDGRRSRFIKRALRGKKGILLDLGCGAGRSFYRSVGPVVGIDISIGALSDAKKIYHAVAQGSVLELPFADESFDFVVSSDLIGHIPVMEKGQLFREMLRVLKKGGQLIHVIETDADNLFYRFAKRDVDLFFKYFIVEISGHFGLEKVSEVRNRFKSLGLKEVKTEIIYDLFVPLYDFLRFYGPDYRKKYPVVRMLAAIAEKLQKNFYINFAADIVLGVKARAFELFRRVENAQDIGVIYKKD